MKVVRLADAERPVDYPRNPMKSLGRGSVTKRALDGTKDQ